MIGQKKRVVDFTLAGLVFAQIASQFFKFVLALLLPDKSLGKDTGLAAFVELTNLLQRTQTLGKTHDGFTSRISWESADRLSAKLAESPNSWDTNFCRDGHAFTALSNTGSLPF